MNTLAIPKLNLQHLLIGLFMLLAAGLAVVLTPKAKLADQGPRIDLETMIPKQFGDWRVDESIVPLQVSPDVQAKLDKIYNQTLARTYTNSQGERIMLSIAYGGDQSDSMKMHKPEVCYPAQGFEVIRKTRAKVDYQGQSIPVKRVVTRQGARIEPLTYWMIVGDKATGGDTDRKLAQIMAGLTGTIPDGMLVRVSSIDRDAQRAFALQDEFTGALFVSLDAASRMRVFGVTGIE